MSKSITFLSVLGALGVGGVIGVLSTKTYFEEKYRKIADDEINSVIAEFKSNNSEKTEKKESKPHKDGEDLADYTERIRDYSSIFSERVDKAELLNPTEEDVIKPYLISIDDFDEATPGYAKRQLLYYMDDGMLVDAEVVSSMEEENVVDVSATVGNKLLDEFDDSLESSCYIRNESVKEDYEVSKVFGAYGELLGMND